MTRENATFADRFQAFPFEVTKEQFPVSTTAMYGLRGRTFFLALYAHAHLDTSVAVVCLSAFHSRVYPESSQNLYITR
jgi:hypothetical protein